MISRTGLWIIACAAFCVVLLKSLFIVSEVEYALVFQFGEMQKVHSTPGLKMKVPFIQDVAFIDRRIMAYQKPSFDVTLQDQERIVVDVYSLFRVEDPFKFYKSLRDEMTARLRLDEIIPGTLKAVFGSFTLAQITSQDRGRSLEKLLEEINKQTEQLGLYIVDARIRRTDLPPKNSQAIFERMKSERQRAAREIRAQGEELSQEIRSAADKEVSFITADADRKSQLLRGEADARSIRIMAEAVTSNFDFYSFYKHMETYKRTLRPENTQYLLSPKSDFFKFMTK